MPDLTPQKILHIALESDIPDLHPDESYPVLYVVLWWYNIPLGHLKISSQQLPMSASKFKQQAVRSIMTAVTSYLQADKLPSPQIDDLIARSEFDPDEILQQWKKPFLAWCQQRLTPAHISISVVICTRDRPEYVKECLRSLQTLSEVPDEIVVVDNAPSSNATQQIVAQIPGVKYVLEPQPGLDFARNAGIRHSSSELIAYTDDDVKVHPDWILQIRRAFQDPEVMAVTGLVCAAELETKSQYIFESYWSFNRGYQPLTYGKSYFHKYAIVGVPSWRIGAGANMAFRRSLFTTTGAFDDRLDAGAAGCSGDSEMWYRVLAEGFKCRYDPTAVVYHFHRRDMEGLHKQLFYYMRGHVTELLIRFERYQHWGNLVRLALLPVYFSYLILLGWSKGSYRYYTILSEIRGCFSGFIFYFSNLNWQFKSGILRKILFYFLWI